MSTEVVKGGTGAIAQAFANAPILHTAEKADKPAKQTKVNPILAMLGKPTFVVGDGKQYPRQVGWGNSKTLNPAGGTNETAAFVVFKPFAGLDLALEGRIYCERFAEGDKSKRVYSISLPFMKADKRDSVGRNAIEAVKGEVRDLYRTWSKSASAIAAASTSKVQPGSWSEDDS